MNVAKAGKLTSGVEVANVSPHGFWLLLGSEELFVPFSSFPWFRDATIAQIDLRLHRLLVVYPGGRSYRLAPKIDAMPLESAVALLR